MRHAALAFILVLMGAALAGCVNTASIDPASAGGAAGFDTSRGWSMPLSPALYDLLPGVKTFVDSFDGTSIALGLFFPEIPGCDWAADTLADECKLPVVMDSGPYFADAPEALSFRPPLIEWLVPRGYVVAHMSVRGTGESGGCMELFSENEQKDVAHIVEWLGDQPWSTGNVGMMGRSYDGTTPFMAAAHAPEALKTIVPISGVPSLANLMFKNGTSEFRGPIFHSVVYWGNYGLGAGDGGFGPGGHRMGHVQEQACEAAVQGAAEGVLAPTLADPSSAYFMERDLRDKVLQNYEGSIWIIHGMEDWNVNPSQVVPWFNELQDAGKDVSMWLGVWGHAYPDRSDEHRNVRWDWAERTVTWFDKHLKGMDLDTGPTVEVEDSLFVWRAEESYPPRDATWTDMAFASGGTSNVIPMAAVSRTTEPMEEAVRIAGLPRFHATLTPTATGPTYAFAELYDIFPDGRAVRIGWAAMNLEYADGGISNKKTLVPGQAVLAKMEFEPVDALVAEGHRLQLVVHMDGVEDIIASPSPAPMMLAWDQSTLSLPLVDRPNVIPTYAPPGQEARS